jgi:histidinol-phosphate aminotransferase
LSCPCVRIKFRRDSGIAYLNALERLKKRVLDTKSYSYEEVHEVLRLHLNECLYKPPPHVVEAVNRVIAESNLYPHLDMFNRFRELLAKYNRIDASMVHPFPGADSALRTLFHAFTDPGDSILFLRPTFSMIEIYSNYFGLRKLCLDLAEGNDTWIVDYDKLVELSKRSDLVVIVDPNNPTGNPVFGGEKKLLESIALSTKGFVVVDETYHEFSGYTVANYVSEFPNVVVVRSLSKAFCLAGFRLGYIIAHPEVLKNVAKVLTTFDIPTPSLAAGIAALDNLDYHMKIIERIKLTREKLYAVLKSMGFKVYKSYANFLLVKDGRALDKHLLNHGIAIKRVGKDLYRISVGSEEAVERLLQALSDLT